MENGKNGFILKYISKVYSFLILLILVTALSVSSYIVHEEFERSYIIFTQHSLDSQLFLKDQFKDIQDNIDVIAQMPSLKDMTEAKTQNRKAMRKAEVEDDFYHIMSVREDFKQIRYINESGHEVVRVNNVGDKTEVVPEEELQDNSDRDYFTKTMSLDDGQTYISDFDLYTEDGRITEPIKPNIRFAKKVYTPEGEDAGIVAINVRAQDAIDFIKTISGIRYENLAIVDGEGYFWKKSTTQVRRYKEEITELNDVVEQSSAIVVITDTSGNIEYVNQKFVETSGYEKDEVLGKNPRMWSTKKTTKDEYNRLWKKIKSGDSWSGTLQNRRKNGQLFWEKAIITPIKDKSGKIVKYAQISEDITEIVEMQKRLAENERLLENVFTLSAVGIALVRTDGSIIRHNESFRKIIDASMQKIKKVNIKDYFKSQGDQEFEKTLEKMLKGSAAKECEKRFVTAKQKEKWARINMIPVRRQDKGIDHLILLMTDVTEQKRIDQMKNDLISFASHELKTPLTSISSMTNMVYDQDLGKINQKQQSALKLSIENIKRLNDIIRTMLDVSRVEAKKIKYKKEKFNLKAAVDDAVETAKALAEERGIKIKNKAASKTTVETDRDRLIQVVINLITNAVKYNKEGGTVWVQTQTVGNRFEITVRDDGVGISPDDLPHIFDKMYQAKKTQRQTGGLGFGLYLGKKMIEDLGGKIDVESVLGEGTQFTITLPYKKTKTIR